jgi:hypothetical protein
MAKKNTRKKVFCSSNVDKEAWITYRGIIHSRFQSQEQLLNPCKGHNCFLKTILKTSVITIPKKTTGQEKYHTIKTKFDQPTMIFHGIFSREKENNAVTIQLLVKRISFLPQPLHRETVVMVMSSSKSKKLYLLYPSP